jgi:hypothetical protein
MADQPRSPRKRQHSRLGGADTGAGAGTGDAASADARARKETRARAGASADTGTETRADARTSTGTSADTAYQPDAFPVSGPVLPEGEPAPDAGSVGVPKQPGKTKRWQLKKQATAEAEAAPKQATETLIAVAEMLGQAAGGPPMRDEQKMLVREGLPELMKRMTPAAIAQTQAVLYPGLVILGFGSYALEVWQTVSAKAAYDRVQKQAQASAAATARASAEVTRENETRIDSVQLTPSNGSILPGVPPEVVDDLKSHDGRDFIQPRAVL